MHSCKIDSHTRNLWCGAYGGGTEINADSGTSGSLWLMSIDSLSASRMWTMRSKSATTRWREGHELKYPIASAIVLETSTS